MFLDTYFYKVIGTNLGKAIYLYRAGKIAVKNQNRRRAIFFVVALSDFSQGSAKCAAIVFLVIFCVNTRGSKIQNSGLRLDFAPTGKVSLT